MTSNGFERFLLLERASGSKNRAISSVFEMRLSGKKVHIRHGNKGQKLARNVVKKNSVAEAIALFTDKRKQKINDGYRIMKEQDKNNLKPQPSIHDAPSINGKAIAAKPAASNHADEAAPGHPIPPASHGRLKNVSPSHPIRARKPNAAHEAMQRAQRLKAPVNANGNHKVKKRSNKRNQHKKKKKEKHHIATESSVSAASSSMHSQGQENHSQTANGNASHHSIQDDEDDDGADEEDEQAEDDGDDAQIDEFRALHMQMQMRNGQNNADVLKMMRADDQENNEEDEQEDADADDNEDEDDEDCDENSSSSSSATTAKSSVRSGRSSDNDYEMDYEKMSHVMNDALHQNVDTSKLDWKPLKLWVRFDEYHDRGGEYAFAPQQKRIAGSCHELRVIYMRSTSARGAFSAVVYKRLLKLARDPEEDNLHHFETERNVAQYLMRMATMVNHTFASRHDVCVWPVETIQFEYGGELKWATVQPPFLPHKNTNKIFVKIEPNSGKPCVDDPVVGRYQHLFASITRGLDLIRDWQGYGVTQQQFLDVCDEFNVRQQTVTQIKVRKSPRLRQQTQVLVVIDPVLTTYNAHYETNNPTDFGVKAIDEWKFNHDCVRCRCRNFHILSANVTDQNADGMQFGVADPDQRFFDMQSMPKETFDAIQQCRQQLGIWCGDDCFEEDNIDDDDDDTQENEANQD